MQLIFNLFFFIRKHILKIAIFMQLIGGVLSYVSRGIIPTLFSVLIILLFLMVNSLIEQDFLRFKSKLYNLPENGDVLICIKDIDLGPYKVKKDENVKCLTAFTGDIFNVRELYLMIPSGYIWNIKFIAYHLHFKKFSDIRNDKIDCILK